MLRITLTGLLVVAIVAVSFLSSCAEEIATYAEWCKRLDELHDDMEARQRSSAAGFWFGVVLTVVGSVACELAILGDVDVSIVLGSVVAVLVGSILVVQRALSQDSIRSEIAGLEEAGRYRMWFYPCDEVGSD